MNELFSSIFFGSLLTAIGVSGAFYLVMLSRLAYLTWPHLLSRDI